MNIEIEQHDARVVMTFDCDEETTADQLYEQLERQLALGEFRFRVRRASAANDEAPLLVREPRP